MSTSTLLSNAGFFNSYGDDRLYDATDFSEYLSGIISNGCFPPGPTGTGFKVKPNPAQILALPPSVLISVGKVYYDGMWANNKEEFVLNLGTGQVSGIFDHLLYFCFDTNEVGGRTVSIEHVAGTVQNPTPVMPANGAGKFYLPLAKISNACMQRNPIANPILADITDQRTGAGVSATAVGPGSIIPGTIVAADLSPTLATQVATPTNIGPTQLAKGGFYLAYFLSSYETPHGPTANVTYNYSNGAAMLSNYIPPCDMTIFILGGFTCTNQSPVAAAVNFDYFFKVRNNGVDVIEQNFVFNGASNQSFGGAIVGAFPVKAGEAVNLVACGVASTARMFKYTRANGIILALPR